MCATAGSASAASLTAATECRLVDGEADCIYRHVFQYVGAAEPNRVIVASGGGGVPDLQEAVVVYDPGVAITAGDHCIAPTGKSVGLCVGTPESYCQPFGGCWTGLATFSVGELALGGGADTLRLMPGSPPAEVSAGSGNDTIDSHNQATDRIECGNGVDTVSAERRDVVFSTCENVTRGLGLPKP